jgi:hypothetical protein
MKKKFRGILDCTDIKTLKKFNNFLLSHLKILNILLKANPEKYLGFATNNWKYLSRRSNF